VVPQEGFEPPTPSLRMTCFADWRQGTAADPVLGGSTCADVTHSRSSSVSAGVKLLIGTNALFDHVLDDPSEPVDDQRRALPGSAIEALLFRVTLILGPRSPPFLQAIAIVALGAQASGPPSRCSG
jgi:hypothetical protein